MRLAEISPNPLVYTSMITEVLPRFRRHENAYTCQGRLSRRRRPIELYIAPEKILSSVYGLSDEDRISITAALRGDFLLEEGYKYPTFISCPSNRT